MAERRVDPPVLRSSPLTDSQGKPFGAWTQSWLTWFVQVTNAINGTGIFPDGPNVPGGGTAEELYDIVFGELLVPRSRQGSDTPAPVDRSDEVDKLISLIYLTLNKADYADLASISEAIIAVALAANETDLAERVKAIEDLVPVISVVGGHDLTERVEALEALISLILPAHRDDLLERIQDLESLVVILQSQTSALLDRESNNDEAFTTWNPSDKNDNITLSGDNLIATSTLQQYKLVRAIKPISSGKLYWEIAVGGDSAYHSIGISMSGEPLTATVGDGAAITLTAGYGYRSNGSKATAHAETAYGDSYTIGDVIGVALDFSGTGTNGKIWFSKNGVWQNSGDPVAGVNPAFHDISISWVYPFYPSASPGANGAIDTANFGASSFSYPVPAGFYRGIRA